MSMAAAAAASFQVSTPFLKKPFSISSLKVATFIYSKQKQQGVCSVSKRSLLSICLTSTLLFPAGSRDDAANAAVLEADDDLELLEKVKKDRQKRIDKQLLIDSSKKETGNNRESRSI